MGGTLRRVTHSAVVERVRHMLELEGQVVYRAYSCETSGAETDYRVHEERSV